MSHKNLNLIYKERQERLRAQADNILRQSKAKFKGDSAIERAKKMGGSAIWSKELRLEFERLLSVADEKSDLLEDREYIIGLGWIAAWSYFYINPPEEWRPRSHNLRRQFASLVRHLFCKYDVPLFMDDAWVGNPSADRREQEWFIHVGYGGNIRKAGKLPIPLTKMMAHHFLKAPYNFTINEALRYGQVLGMGGGERLAKAIVASELRNFSTIYARSTDRVLGVNEAPDDLVNVGEEFWKSVINFLIRNDNMLDMNQVAPIIDYIKNQKFVPIGRVAVNGTFVTLGPPQPGFSMAGRTIETLVNQVEAWHASLAKIKDNRNLSWESCGIAGFDRVEGVEGNQKRYIIEELLSSRELKAEGTKMRHCVYSYAHSCHIGRCAIFSMKGDYGQGLEHRLTIEIDPKLKLIRQARGKFNEAANQLDKRIMQAWALQRGLSMGRGALDRWA